MKAIAFLLIAALTLDSSRSACQTLAPSDGTKQAAKAKAEVQRRGIGEKSRVRVKLRDGTEVRGYISKVEEHSFDVTDKKSGTITSIRYDDANELHRQGMSKTAKILIAIGIAAAWIGIATALACHSEGGPHC
jgi:small nuclear ribonucleoprotein (snRNP)-like protein